MTEDKNKNLYLDLIKTVYQGWFDSSDSYYPESFSKSATIKVNELVRQADVGVCSLEQAYREAYAFGVSENSRITRDRIHEYI